jgi:hypothetical protein
VPVLPLLEEWLNAECTTCQALTPKDRAGLDRLVNYYGRGMQDVDSVVGDAGCSKPAYHARVATLCVQHSLATRVRNLGAWKWDLMGDMNRDAGDVTETYAVGEFPSVVRALIGN